MSITRKTYPVADTTIKISKELYTSLIADGWKRIALPPTGREMSITKNYMIFENSESVSDYGRFDSVKTTEASCEADIEAAVKMNTDKAASEITEMGDISVIRAMRSNKPSIVISLDTEYYYDANGVRNILSWQLCFINKGLLYRIIVFSTTKELISFNRLLSFLLEYYDLYKPYLPAAGCKYRDCRCWIVPVKGKRGRVISKRFHSYDEAIENCCDQEIKSKLSGAGPKAKAENDRSDYPLGYVYDYREANKHSIPVTLLMHFSQADLTTFNVYDDHNKDIIKYCSQIQGGLVTLKPVTMHIKCDQSYGRFFPVSLSVRDTKCFAPANKKKLDDLGETIGFKKLLLPDGYSKDNMLEFLQKEPKLFVAYATTDAAITVLYAAKLWGINAQMPITLFSASCNAAVKRIKTYFGLAQDDNEGYDRIYRGLKTVRNGKALIGKRLKAVTDMVPIDADCEIYQTFAANAYKGGYNASSKIGYFYIKTYDYDLHNAYPTAMACVPDIDWEDVIIDEKTDVDVSLSLFASLTDPIFAYIKFDFPSSVKYPCIPIKEDGNIVYPLSSNNEYYYATGFEIYTALKLGARIHAKRLFKARVKTDQDGNTSYCLKDLVRSFINDRTLAKEVFGAKSLEQLIIKEAVNSLYGKTAQNILKKKSWSAMDNQMQEIGASKMTSPYHASMTTALVRCILLSAMNQVEEKGYFVYSVTTDGFITNAPEEIIKSLDLYGFKELIEQARTELTGSSEMWEIKHSQEELLNITTRGNVGINRNKDAEPGCFDDILCSNDDDLEGVLAHNGFRTGEVRDSLEDRIEFAKKVLSRTDRIESRMLSSTKFKKLSSYDAREDFRMEQTVRNLSMDFDLKRKPIRSSIYTEAVTIQGDNYEIACFDTEPYANIDEYRIYKTIGQNSIVLRTANDWYAFFSKAAKAASVDKRTVIKDYNKRVLQSCVMAVVQGIKLDELGGKAEIGLLLDKKAPVSQKLSFINQFNSSDTPFSKNDWRNASRKDRLYQILPEKEFICLLRKMLSDGSRND